MLNPWRGEGEEKECEELWVFYNIYALPDLKLDLIWQYGKVSKPKLTIKHPQVTESPVPTQWEQAWLLKSPRKSQCSICLASESTCELVADSRGIPQCLIQPETCLGLPLWSEVSSSFVVPWRCLVGIRALGGGGADRFHLANKVLLIQGFWICYTWMEICSPQVLIGKSSRIIC